MTSKLKTNQLQQAITAHQEGRLEEAEILYREVLKTNPSHIDANHYLAILLLTLGRLDEAEIIFKKAIELKPDSDVYQNLANTQIQLKKFEEAEINYRKVLEFDPDKLDIQYNLGNTLRELNRLDEAEVIYKKLIELKPDYFMAHNNLAITLRDLNKIDEALKFYNNFKALKPDTDFLSGTILHFKMQLNIWDDLHSELQELIKKINIGEKFINPFPTLSLIDDPELHRKVAKIFSNHKSPKSNLFPKISKYHNHKKIKIGYFSADFNNHPVGKLTAELYELHNKNKFEIHAFSFGLDKKDEINTLIRKGVDHFHDVHRISDIDLVKLTRSLEIDIAIDLTGYTAKNRAEIFAMKVAPIQINYLGYSSTMGGDHMNYLIADKTIIPEKILFRKNCLFAEQLHGKHV